MMSTGDSTEARVSAVEKDYADRHTKLFIRFAFAESILLAIAILIVYVFRVVEPDTGIWILIAIALIGGLTLSVLLVRQMQARTQAIARARGENPLF